MSQELDAGELILTYRKIRAKLELMKTQYEEKCKPYKDAQSLIEIELKRLLDKVKADSVQTEHGTAYKSRAASVRMVDKQALLEFVGKRLLGLEEEEEGSAARIISEFLDVKPSKEAAETYLEDHDMDIPGVETSRFIKINVRK